jgi:hypothetical protein
MPLGYISHVLVNEEDYLWREESPFFTFRHCAELEEQRPRLGKNQPWRGGGEKAWRALAWLPLHLDMTSGPTPEEDASQKTR